MDSLKLILSNRRYFAPVWVFASLNILVSTWILYIPYVKQKLSLSDSEVGFALFSYAFGVFIILPMAPFFIKTIGVGRHTIISMVLLALGYLTPLLAPNYILLCTLLFITGIMGGSTDITMNALVSEIEKRDGCNIMSAAHGFFSLGGVIGVTIGSMLMALGILPIQHMFLSSIFIIISNLLLARSYFSIEEKPVLTTKDKANWLRLRPLFGFAIIAFIIMSSEGAIEHWSNLYFLEIVQIENVNLAGMGFFCFSTTMTIGRFFGDKISEKIGSMRTLLLGCIIACIGYLFVLPATFLLTGIGFGILGLGLSVMVPELFRIAGTNPNIPASVGISFVSGIGFLGFLLGPVVLGYISDQSSLRVSFLSLFLLSLFALAMLFFRYMKSRV